MTEEPPAIGHNSGLVVDVSQTLVKAVPFAAKSEALCAAFERWKTATENGINSDELQGKSGDFAKQLGATARLIEEERVATKAPVLEIAKLIDAAFKTLSDPLVSAKAEVEKVMTVYAVRKEAAARAEAKARADAAAKAAQEAADLAAEEAAMLGDVAPEPVAMPVYAAPTAADASRVIGDHGTVSSLRGKWKVRIIDPALIPAQYLMPNIAAIEAAMEGSRIKKGEPTAKIAGVEFYLEQKVGVR